MLFVQPIYLVFFVIVFTAYWSIRSNRRRKALLLLASYIFYGAWDWRFLSLIWVSTMVDYLVGLQLGRTAAAQPRRLLLALSLVVNLGLLGFFKYFHFFVDSFTDLVNALGLPPPGPTTLNIILPVGISFYTFQTLSYTIDIYRGKLEPTRDLLDLSLFVGFFPQLVAGPIVRAADFLPQLESRRLFSSVDVRWALVLFLVGFFKKVCVSDNIAPAIDAYFANPQEYTAVSAMVAIALYAIQIYCDFSGYSDMAIASAALLGYRLCLNFDFPLLAPNITEFWRRWHISLSTWLKDYLYISLGGNRKGPRRTMFNVMGTMVLGGLWHGAAWTFVIFGMLHGMALLIHRGWVLLVGERFRSSRGWSLLCCPITFYWFCLTLIFFRAQSFSQAWITCRSCLLFESPGTEQLALSWLCLAALLLLVHWISYRRFVTEWWRRGPDWAFACGLGLVVALIMTLVPTTTQPFIYFQF
jgi:alginate O-acetyltransferase complex protein AlgI